MFSMKHCFFHPVCANMSQKTTFHIRRSTLASEERTTDVDCEVFPRRIYLKTALSAEFSTICLPLKAHQWILDWKNLDLPGASWSHY